MCLRTCYFKHGKTYLQNTGSYILTCGVLSSPVTRHGRNVARHGRSTEGPDARADEQRKTGFSGPAEVALAGLAGLAEVGLCAGCPAWVARARGLRRGWPARGGPRRGWPRRGWLTRRGPRSGWPAPFDVRWSSFSDAEAILPARTRTRRVQLYTHSETSAFARQRVFEWGEFGVLFPGLRIFPGGFIARALFKPRYFSGFNTPPGIVDCLCFRELRPFLTAASDFAFLAMSAIHLRLIKSRVDFKPLSMPSLDTPINLAVSLARDILVTKVSGRDQTWLRGRERIKLAREDKVGSGFTAR
ncbi:hypothetical protein Taro_029312 [Colocasia esculenta]|uniref:Uncharacterized protein n=1 Tax=Colocasia esculenta TaxID=4460 RepID=A0A843VUI4_COLES|nr:hypothetical protein [Colocasia esculenta]